MKGLLRILLIALMLWVPQIEMTAAQQSNVPVVRAVLFMSPTCGHCHYVITELLLPMAETYGDQLEIVMIDVSQPAGSQLYDQAVGYYEIPEEQRGVPTLIIGDAVLVGSGEIPARFPDLVADGLASGGVGWPEMPGLSDVLVVTEKPTPQPTAAPVTPNPVTTAAPPAQDLPVYLA